METCISYSMDWARRTSAVFTKKYSRAAKIFKLISNHSEDYPAWLLAHDQPKWNRYKKLIKFIHDIDIAMQPCSVSKHLCSYIEEVLSQEMLYPR